MSTKQRGYEAWKELETRLIHTDPAHDDSIVTSPKLGYALLDLFDYIRDLEDQVANPMRGFDRITERPHPLYTQARRYEE